jgi:hypothetical protein
MESTTEVPEPIQDGASKGQASPSGGKAGGSEEGSHQEVISCMGSALEGRGLAGWNGCVGDNIAEGAEGLEGQEDHLSYADAVIAGIKMVEPEHEMLKLAEMAASAGTSIEGLMDFNYGAGEERPRERVNGTACAHHMLRNQHGSSHHNNKPEEVCRPEAATHFVFTCWWHVLVVQACDSVLFHIRIPGAGAIL